MHSTYKISIVPQNLSKEETIVQIVDVLDHLNSITQDIFSRVNQRIKENSDKISGISKRVEDAAAQVDLLKGDKRAKTVFSSSKYPAVDVKRDYISIFQEKSDIEFKRHEVKHTKFSSTYKPLTKLQFYHVKVPEQKPNNVTEGLGDVPSNVELVNDLLLFNTGKNLYKDFTHADSLKGPERRGIREYNTDSELGAAPFSISQRSSLHQAKNDNYLYTPNIEELPVLDVPLDLPDLPGIADDLRYEPEIGSSIAPSALNQPETAGISLDLPCVPSDPVNAIPEMITPPPPPEDLPEPPQVTFETKENLASTVDGNQKSVDESDLLLNKTAPNSVAPDPVIPPPIANLPQTDSRASLMEAIRRAGGSQNAKLKKANPERSQENKTASSGGDLMADLHSKLMMRRKGISGTKKTDQANGLGSVTPDSTLARISLKIPPPPSKSDMESSVSTDDEDWND